MTRYQGSLAILGALVALSLAGCAQEPPINRVGVNVVDKTIFTGSWYMSSVVIDTEFSGSGIGTHPGDSATDFNGSGYTSIPRIRWVIDEDFLYAYRDYEVIRGIDGEPRDPGDELGQPVAAFAVQSHFDIRRAYNPITGEEQNVITENATDRRWYERQFMRVDWSANVLPRYYGQIHDLYEILGIYTRAPATLYVQDASQFPDSWRPQFHYMTCNGPEDTSPSCTSQDREWAFDYDQGDLYSMSFVTQDILAPGDLIDPLTGYLVNFCQSNYSDAPEFCTSYAVYVRHSFLKISDRRQYEPLNYHEGLMDQHGYFRLDGLTYDRSTAADDPAHRYTDFLNYGINRYNMWDRWHDDAGAPIPYTERGIRPIVWYSSAEMPAHLMKPSFQSVSDWNVVLMEVVRSLRNQPLPVYQRQDCQRDDPEGYCYCAVDPDTGETLNPTCQGMYDAFEPPDQARSRLASGEPYDCYVEVPAGAEPDWNDAEVASRARDEHFDGWFGARFVGADCVTVLRPNTCNNAAMAAAEAAGTVDSLVCEERGDIRFKLLSYVDMADTPFLGVAQMRGDPVSGETLTGDANIGGGVLDSYRTSSMLVYDLLTGVSVDEDIFDGEDVRGYLENLNNVDLPAPPRTFYLDALRAGDAIPDVARQLNTRMDHAMERMELLRGPEGRANTFSDRRQNLVGTDIERRLTENWETLMAAGLVHLPAGTGPEDINEAVLDRASPFRMSAHDMMASFQDRQSKLAERSYLMPNEYTDWGAMYFVNKHLDWPRARVEFTLNRVLYGNAMAHELGHCYGLRHDFAGNTDRDNYFDDYYVINESIPLPVPADFDRDRIPGLNTDEQAAYEDAYTAARQRRELAGIDETMNSSIMEYTGAFYARARTRLGRWDHAAILFGYGELDVAGDNSAGRTLDLDNPLMDEITPESTPRMPFRYYEGGEVCNTDDDCPFGMNGLRSPELLDSNKVHGLTQRCVANPHGAGHSNICSNFNADVRAAATADPRIVPVDFQYCTDDRTSRGITPGTIGWCNLFDEGDSYREIVRNFTEAYDRTYIFSAFRRYRRHFGVVSYLLGPFFRNTGPLMSIYQNMIYQYHSNPSYRTQLGPFGFYDQFLATADILNFYASILAAPDVGAYRWNAPWQRYQRSHVDPETPGAQLRIPVGLGKYVSSVYQSGLSGIERVERVGTFYDKLYTVQLMALRGFQSRYTPDVPFFTNFYDVFPLEMQQIFGGMIRDDPSSYSPRVICRGGTFPTCTNPRVMHMDFYRGDCSPGSTTCRPDPIDITYRDLPVLEAGGNFLLQSYAAIFALLEFPTFFDTTFQNQLFVCVEGAGDCFAPSDSAREGVDYIRFTSERYGKTYLAWQVEPTAGVANQTSIGFAMLEEAKQMAFILRALQTYRGDFGGTPYSMANLSAAQRAELTAIGYTIPVDASTLNSEENRIDGRLRDLESFFNYLIQLQRDIGVADYLGY